MREIKFRAWNTDSNEWDNQQITQVYVGLDGKIIATDGRHLWENLKCIELTQYTGQYDPTATEFCEGDIIKDHTDYWEVKFFDGAFWIVAIGGNAEPELLCGNDYMEIIGNRFENPELLEGNR